MRLLSCAGAVLSTLALSACGASDEQAWSGPPVPAEDGNVPVDSFEAYRETVEETWETTPVLLAAEFIQLGERNAANTSIVGSGAAEGGGRQTVTITLDEVLDDAVRAERWMLTIEPAGDGFRLVSARRTQRCQPGRGHEDFASEPCL